jgi:hypothetical protein
MSEKKDAASAHPDLIETSENVKQVVMHWYDINADIIKLLMDGKKQVLYFEIRDATSKDEKINYYGDCRFRGPFLAETKEEKDKIEKECKGFPSTLRKTLDDDSMKVLIFCKVTVDGQTLALINAIE